MKQKKFREAIDIFTELIEIGPINSQLLPNLLYNRALAHSEFGDLRSSINDCTAAMENSKVYSKSLLLRAKCYKTMRNFKRCVVDCEILLKIDWSEEVMSLLNEAKVSLQRSRSKNHYDILDINRGATLSEVKKAYKKLALIHHPDKHANAPDDERLEQQEIFKRISQAYEVLLEAEKSSFLLP